MYRLVLYILIGYISIAVVLGFLHILIFSPLEIIFSTLFLVGVCWVANIIFSSAYDVPANVESVYITGLILALIINPVSSMDQGAFVFWTAVLAMASKYILAFRNKHIFNPAAIAVVITGFALSQSASWWVGTAWMVPFLVAGGFLIVRKLRYEDMIYSFFITALGFTMFFVIFRGGNILSTLNQFFFRSFFLFLGTIMLTEPLTLPPKKNLQMLYGALVGFISIPQVHIGTLFFTPELALCIGNIFAYIVSPKFKLIVNLHEKIQLSSDIVDFVFKPTQKVAFTSGQYMEWTLSHPHTDSRGNRRYFTIASSPTEETIRLGVKFYEKGSSYKKALYNMNQQMSIVGAQLSGEFTLPKNRNQKLVFLAGGIGITPYRSILKYLIDTKEQRNIVMFYANKTANEIAYKDVFDAAENELGIRTVYTLTDTGNIPQGWPGKVGRITPEMIAEAVPDYSERLFYLSGPHAMVTGYEDVLKSMGLKSKQIKKDFFPGLV